jgi:hypothetical protein
MQEGMRSSIQANRRQTSLLQRMLYEEKKVLVLYSKELQFVFYFLIYFFIGQLKM